jgi:hypothetical protein
MHPAPVPASHTHGMHSSTPARHPAPSCPPAGGRQRRGAPRRGPRAGRSSQDGVRRRAVPATEDPTARRRRRRGARARSPGPWQRWPPLAVAAHAGSWGLLPAWFENRVRSPSLQRCPSRTARPPPTPPALQVSVSAEALALAGMWELLSGEQRRRHAHLIKPPHLPDLAARASAPAATAAASAGERSGRRLPSAPQGLVEGAAAAAMPNGRPPAETPAAQAPAAPAAAVQPGRAVAAAAPAPALAPVPFLGRLTSGGRRAPPPPPK